MPEQHRSRVHSHLAVVSAQVHQGDKQQIEVALIGAPERGEERPRLHANA